MSASGLSEFDVIATYFDRRRNPRLASRNDVGVGDDAAIVTFDHSTRLAVCSDMLVVDRHFLPDDDPSSIGWKSLAVNLSDLAAVGAEPRHVLLSIALPAVDEAWLEGFSEGFFDCADRFGVDLIGGDTTAGPLTISITAIGVLSASPLLRKGAKVGDDIWVSGTVGLAAIGLRAKTGGLELDDAFERRALEKLDRPIPRVELGPYLVGIANSAIDVSDGLIADLGHVVASAGVGAVIEIDPLLTLDPAFAALEPETLHRAICHGGDDYELCFTADPEHRDHLERLSHKIDLPLTRIGQIVENPGVTLTLAEKPVTVAGRGFDHFKKGDGP